MQFDEDVVSYVVNEYQKIPATHRGDGTSLCKLLKGHNVLNRLNCARTLKHTCRQYKFCPCANILLLQDPNTYNWYVIFGSWLFDAGKRFPTLINQDFFRKKTLVYGYVISSDKGVRRAAKNAFLQRIQDMLTGHKMMSYGILNNN